MMDAITALREAMQRMDCFTPATHSPDDPGFDEQLAADAAFNEGVQHCLAVVRDMIDELEAAEKPDIAQTA